MIFLQLFIHSILQRSARFYGCGVFSLMSHVIDSTDFEGLRSCFPHELSLLERLVPGLFTQLFLMLNFLNAPSPNMFRCVSSQDDTLKHFSNLLTYFRNEGRDDLELI